MLQQYFRILVSNGRTLRKRAFQWLILLLRICCVKKIYCPFFYDIKKKFHQINLRTFKPLDLTKDDILTSFDLHGRPSVSDIKKTDVNIDDKGNNQQSNMGKQFTIILKTSQFTVIKLAPSMINLKYLKREYNIFLKS